MNASTSLAHTDIPKEWLCVICNTPIAEQRRRKKARYCTSKCAVARRARERKILNPAKMSLSTGTVGALSELIVSADLLHRGYEVFRALSPHASCDLAIVMDGQLYRVEVRTGYKTARGSIQTTRRKRDIGRFDIFAIVIGKDIVYEPDLTQLTTR